MNPERHKTSFKDLYQHLLEGDLDKANVIRVFYEEYLAVNDLPAELYLETVEKVFQTYDLPLGKLTYKGRVVNTAAIRHANACQRRPRHAWFQNLYADQKIQLAQAGGSICPLQFNILPEPGRTPSHVLRLGREDFRS